MTVDGVTTFIVQLTPKEMTKDEAGKLGTASTYKLRLTYSDKATAKIEGGLRRYRGRCEMVRWNYQSYQCGNDQDRDDYRPESGVIIRIIM